MSEGVEVYGVVIPDEHREIVKTAFEMSGYDMNSSGFAQFIVDGCIEMIEGDSEDEEFPRGGTPEEKSSLAERLNEYIKNNPEQVRHAMDMAGHLGPIVKGLWANRKSK